ncbi:hypothetical protein [Candidatus Blastococcus massiliensis]|uniref:hypothetical protein n=1 Tax=Candidatus Blastococcus massiliensis TaxID=1470358 RepID=UPI0039C690E1
MDFQRDFVEPGSFGESLGNDVSRLRTAVGPTRAVLAAFRERGWPAIHTREGHRPDLTDLFPAKRDRGAIVGWVATSTDLLGALDSSPVPAKDM